MIAAGTTGLSGQRLLAALSRGVLIIIGTFSIWWGITTFPVFWQDSHLDHMAESILNGEQFKKENLQSELATFASNENAWPRPESLRSATILQLSLTEQPNTAENEKPAVPALDQLQTSARRSLSVTPGDPLLWLVLFWANKMKDDRSQDNFANLRMSYLLGPHEGWVASRRNYIALANFTDLPEDLKEAALTEFKDLVVSGYIETATLILAGPGWTIRDKLLFSLKDAPDDAKRQFASSVDELSDDIVVPGVEKPEARPWR
jgi:hypothetical protein